MKKFVSLLLVLALALSLSGAVFADAEVRPSTQKFLLDGKSVSITAYNIDGYNYVGLRSLAAALNGTEKQFSVEYEEESGTIVVVAGAAYTPTEAVYFAPAVVVDENGLVTNAAESTQKLRIDDEIHAGLSVWNIGGFNYFKLAELQPLLGFGLGYDWAARTVQLTGDGSAVPVSDPPLPAAASYVEVYKALNVRRSGGGTRAVKTYAAADAAEPEEAPAETNSGSAGSSSASAGGGESGAGYSGTNVQVEGIDEGDIVKTDGQYIYVLNGDYHLTILKADGKNTKVVSQTAVGLSEYDDGNDKDSYSGKNKRPQEMFVSSGTLAILSNHNSYSQYRDDDGWRWENESYSCVDFYDVSDPASPKLLSALGQDGYIIGSRMQNGKIYVVTGYWVYNGDEDDPGTYVPCTYRNGEATILPVDRIWICGESSEYVVTGVYDVSSAALEDAKSLLGGGDELYMSANNLYILGSERNTKETAKRRESVYTVTDYKNTSSTSIVRFDLTGGGLALAATGTVPGYIDSQFSADEYGGYLRIVTTTNEYGYTIYEDETYGFRNYKSGESASSSGLYILDRDLNVTGSVTGLAKDEYVYSVRFDGTIAYFCTYRQVDPLFAVDVSDPANPKVLSALKISGFSEYLHAWTENKLFGFGYEADEETGRTEGLKLVMFDTTDKADVKVENTYHLDADYSEALYNHKAFFIVPEKNLIGFLGEGDYYVFSYDEDGGFRELAHFSFDTWEWNVRGLYIGGWAYVVGNEQLMILDRNTWAAPTCVKIAVPEARDQ